MRERPKTATKARTQAQLLADEARRATMKRRWENLQYANSMGEHMRRRWSDPQYANTMSDNTRRSWAEGETRQRRTDGITRAWKRAAVKKRHSQGLKRSNAKPEVRRRRSEASKRVATQPEMRKRRSDAMKHLWADADYKKRTREAIARSLRSPKVRKRKSASGKRMIANNPGIVERLRIARARVAAERRAILEAAPRPADWSRKPIAWRIIGTELLLEGSLTNKELARRLDSSDILKCPYGSTWLDSVNRRAFLVFVHRVRKWLKKPGIEGGRTRTSSIHKSRQ